MQHIIKLISNLRWLWVLQIWVTILLCAMCPVYGDEIIIPSNTTKVLVSGQDIKDTPIIIQTQARDYDQPNLDEYTQCNANRDTCLGLCESHTDRKKCEADCPQCPILISHDIAVQGVNDTAFRQPAEQPLNTTNVIKVTNHIHNVIETLQNITANNENNVVVHQNISSTGGKYGFGYSDKGSCCMVLRRSSNCGGTSNGRRRRNACPEKRHRLCSDKHCRAPVMRAKPVHYCTLDEDGNENCSGNVKFEYIPYRSAQRPKCSYIPHWPYVHCSSPQQNVNRNLCQRCVRITYGEILQHGLPPMCQQCFSAPPQIMPNLQSWYPYPSFYYPQPPAYPDTQVPASDASWRIDKMKCRFPDGTITDCGPDVSFVDDFEKDDNSLPNYNTLLPNEMNDNLDFDNFPEDVNTDYVPPNAELDDVDEEFIRQRRQLSRVYKRSKYSLRHRDEI